MPKERNKADDYREKAYAGDTKAMNDLGVCYERGTICPQAYAVPPFDGGANGGDAQAQFATGWFFDDRHRCSARRAKGLEVDSQGYVPRQPACNRLLQGARLQVVIVKPRLEIK